MIKDLWLKAYRRGHVSAGVIALALAYLLKTTWFKWGDLIIDLGREMYVPDRLASGAVLYRDIFYLYGPFPPYFNALLYKIFGTNILALVMGGILVTVLTALLLYKITRMFLNVFFSTFTVIAFLFVLAFGHYVSIGNYNFILPYSYPATHAVLFSLAALYFLFRALDRGVVKDAWYAGLFTFLCLISRAEIGAMLVLSALAVVVVLKCSGHGVRLFRPLVIVPVAAAAVVYGTFFIVAGPRILESNLFDLFKNNAQASPFSRLLSGANASGQNIFLMFKSVLFYGLLAGWFALAGYVAGRIKSLFLGGLIAGAVLLGAGFFMKTFFDFELQYRSIPLIYLIVGILSVVAYFRDGRKPDALKLFALALFSLLIILRILLHIHAWHYGFYILVPGLVLYHVFFFQILPQWMGRKMIARAVSVGFALVLVVLMGQHFAFSKAVYKRRTMRLASPTGEIGVFPGPQGAGVKEMVDYFAYKTPKDATLAVFPEGVMINFLSRRANPLYYYSFLPQDMVRQEVETFMVDDLARLRPDYVVILQRNVEEYGSRGFGVDYGKKILNYVDRNYTAFAQYGPLPFAPDNFSAVIFRRSGSAP